MKFYYTGKLHFALMFICTFGFYAIYWSYKNWQYVKRRDGSNISPVWRSIFLPLWYYNILNELSPVRSEKPLVSDSFKGVLIIGYIVMNGISLVSEQFALIGVFSFICLLPAVSAIEKLNDNTDLKVRQAWPNYTIYLLGGYLAALMLLGSLYILPDGQVVPGTKLNSWQTDFLVNEGLKDESEAIIYFYSGAVLSIEDDGQFITDKHVVSYFRNPDDGELYGGRVRYEEIMDINIKKSTSFLDDTVITISDVGQNQFELWLSTVDKKDGLFIEELLKNWKNKPEVFEPNDVLRDKLNGVWISTEEWMHEDYPNQSIKDYGEDTYLDEGITRGYNISTFPDKEERWEYESKWSIQEGYLHMEILSINGKPPQSPIITKDKIVTITEDVLVLMAEDGTRLFRFRKGQQGQQGQ